ncbi:Natriuretic peptide B [Pteropus alecto]|uniref:Natriuretic peptides B n=1 Tax=Pteropus alecto TaxID=9402 RepID=L5KFQ6_PTEAL|nr:Natriuretic peptide B [Pteropus alecto]
MDPQTALPRVLPLLLLLLLSPLGGRSLPLSSPDPDLELSAVQELQDGLGVTVVELQEEPISQETLRQVRHSAEAWEAERKDSADAREAYEENFQALREPRSRNSSCFGQKIDRIGHSSGLGCLGELPPCHPAHTHPYSRRFHH